MNSSAESSPVPARRSRGLAALAAALCGGLALTACQMGPSGPDGVDSRQFQDVVVPEGFRLLDNSRTRSYSREVGSWRDAKFFYVGGDHIEDAASYVLLRMPHHSWEVTMQQAEDPKARTIRFERGIYTANYTFTRQDGTTSMVVDYTTHYSKR